jgi:flagellar hook-associated protein 2
LSDILSALGAGSGIDIKDLAKSLTDVERKPREEAIQARIDKTEGRISGYSAVMFGLKQLKDAFLALNDRSDFNGATVRNSQPLAVQATADAQASLGQHSVQVTQLAREQITRSGGFAAATTTLNSGNAFSLEINSRGSTVTVDVTRRSPQGVVDAINSKSDQTGVEARLVNTGDANNPVTIVLTGESGAANSFSVGTPAGQAAVAGLDFSTNIQTSQDASATIDGISVTRASNVVDDVIPGIKLELLSTTTSAATLSVARDTAPVKEKITALVDAYNGLQDFLDTLGDSKSEDEEYGGVLANDSLLRYVRDQARSMITATSSTPSGTVTALRDIGVTLDREGRMQIDDTKLDVALLGRFEDIAKAFSADTDNQSMIGDAARGIAGDALKRLDGLMGTDGPILSRSNSAQDQLGKAETDLAELQERMDDVYQRYLDQFAVMDSLVTQMNTLRDSLKGQFENLSAMYSGK